MLPLLIAFALSQETPAPRPAKLTVVDPRVLQFEDGPQAAAGYTFRGGESVFVTFRIGGFKSDGEEDPRISLAYTVQPLDAKGVALAPPESSEIQAELSPQDREWMPIIRYSFALPATPRPGTHSLNIRITDKIAGSSAEAKASFRVESSVPLTAEGLEIQQLRVQRNEDDVQPMAPGSTFRPGDTVWTRFVMTGYRFGDKNRYDLAYGVLLTDASGKTVFEKPAAASLSEDGFYPRLYLPAAFSISLDKNIRPGVYAMTISVEDRIAGQQISARQLFSVE